VSFAEAFDRLPPLHDHRDVRALADEMEGLTEPVLKPPQL